MSQEKSSSKMNGGKGKKKHFINKTPKETAPEVVMLWYTAEPERKCNFEAWSKFILSEAGKQLGALIKKGLKENKKPNITVEMFAEMFEIVPPVQPVSISGGGGAAGFGDAEKEFNKSQSIFRSNAM